MSLLNLFSGRIVVELSPELSDEPLSLKKEASFRLKFVVEARLEATNFRILLNFSSMASTISAPSAPATNGQLFYCHQCSHQWRKSPIAVGFSRLNIFAINNENIFVSF